MNDNDDEKFCADVLLDVFNALRQKYGSFTCDESLAHASKIGISILESIHNTTYPSIREQLKEIWMKEIKDFGDKQKQD